MAEQHSSFLRALTSLSNGKSDALFVFICLEKVFAQCHLDDSYDILMLSRFTSSESKVLLKGFDFEPELKIKEGFVEVRAGDSCTEVKKSSANRLIGFGIPLLFASATNKGIVGPVLALAMSAVFFGNEYFTVMAHSDCGNSPITVVIYLPEKSLGEVYMKDMISWTDYDGSDGSLHFDPNPVRKPMEFCMSPSFSISFYFNIILSDVYLSLPHRAGLPMWNRVGDFVKL